MQTAVLPENRFTFHVKTLSEHANLTVPKLIYFAPTGCQLIVKVHFDDVIVRVIYERDQNTTQFKVLGLIKSNIIALAELKLEIFRNQKLDVI